MVANCVKMRASIPRHSLARIRHLKPLAPYWAGGEYLVLNGAHFLKDIEGAFRLDGRPELFAGFRSGDLIQVLVEESGSEVFRCGQSERVHLSLRERQRPRPHAVEFAKFTDQVRAYLKSRGLSEIFTPTLVTCPGLEPSLEAFSTQVPVPPTAHAPARTITKYLPTSPEIHLKKVIAQGLTDNFEIRPCFRRGEFSDHHANEFLMLEWYRGFADLDLVIEDLKGMLKALGSNQEPRVTDFRALFRQILDFDLSPKTSPEEMRLLAVKMNIDLMPSDTFTDLFHRLMIAFIEPAMAKMGPLIVRRFPPVMAALARLDKDGWADRFEFYWNGLEIANAFYEVTDPAEQTRRWEFESMERRRLGTENLPPDPELIEALEIGLPPTGGIALGMERLYMALYGVSNIRELRIF